MEHRLSRFAKKRLKFELHEVDEALGKEAKIIIKVGLFLLIVLGLIIPIVYYNDGFKVKEKKEYVDGEYIKAADKVIYSVVSITTNKGSGSGIIVRGDGIILTNHHVVSNASEITVITNDKKIFNASFVGTDSDSDVAVIKVNGNNLTAAKLGDSDTIKVGEKIITVGNPFGLEGTVTTGIISATHRNAGATAYKDFIQTDANINPGNSGGPMVNLNGEVIGMNAFIVSSEVVSQGAGFAIPINLAKRIMVQILERGGVERSYIGVVVKDVLKLDEHGDGRILPGVEVISVKEKGPSDKAGIKAGDIIKEIDNEKVMDSNSLRNYVVWIPVNKEIIVKIERDGKEMELKLVVEKRPDKF